MEADDTSNSELRPYPAYGETYPWHAENWARLTRDLDRLPHALLLQGQAGLGKQAFAFRLARTLLCAAPGADAAACGSCRNCQLFAPGTHPDIVFTRPIEDSAFITVDQIRALGDFLGLRPHTAARKVVIIAPAEAMNPNAANALLKLLEEPPLGSVFLLVTPQPLRLPPTVRSRCATVAFRVPEPAMARAWLASHAPDMEERLLPLVGGAPLLALAEADTIPGREEVARDMAALLAGRGDPLRFAARWKVLGAERSLRWAQSYLADAVRKRLVTEAAISRPETKGLFGFFEVISQARELAATPLDQTLLLEDALIRGARLATEVD